MEREQIRPERHERTVFGEAPPSTLDELSALSHAELMNLYARSTVPSDMRALDGELRGRMLAFRGTDHGRIFRLVATLGASARFPWRGKTLTARSATDGAGINRMTIPGVGPGDLFPFKTKFDASALDGKPCVFIDYDHPENPVYIRAIRDEVRQVSPGLFFGPVMLKHGNKLTHLLWFAIQVPTTKPRARA